MQKVDFKKTLKALYAAPAGEFVTVDVPPLQFVKVDGEGDPNTVAAYAEALSWLYSASYAMKFESKAIGRDYVVPPLEGLWWADDPTMFTVRRKDQWQWTMMILVPDFVSGEMFEAAKHKSVAKLGEAPQSLRLEHCVEGPSLQTLHIGSYDAEGPLLAELHDVVMPQQGLTFNGPHHEIYLSDPRRVEASKLKTILRQPVRAVE
ncbi:MAG: GyrI-like domain-containing protein [Sulfitobacter sp.]